jgi:RNA polymerase-binding transcription factor
MRTESKDNQTDGYEMLKGLLTGLQSKAQQRIKTLRKDQEQDTDSGPADAMDSANSTEDVEIHAGLIAREEEKLIGLDEALTRVDAGKYGKCLKCHETIPFERLMAVPFASYCVDCQAELNRNRPGWGDGGTIEPYDHQWTVPEEMEESTERDNQSSAPEENLAVRNELPGGTGPVTRPKLRAAVSKGKSRHQR